MPRLLMTQSLLSSWLYLWSDFDNYGDKAEEYREKANQAFLATLRREPTPTSKAMQKGIDFENLVTSICDGSDPSDHAWYEAAKEIAGEVRDGQLQITATKNITISGVDLLLYGRLDCLKAGVITDIKFSGKYKVGKFYNSPQHPMYMELVPEAHKFVYLVSNGKRVWRETYRRAECRPIGDIIVHFIDYLKYMGLFDVYAAYWGSKNE